MPDELTDDELLAELELAEDPDDLRGLRALAAQRGLWSAARLIPVAAKREIAANGGGS